MGLKSICIVLGIIIVPFFTKAQTMLLRNNITEEVDTISPLQSGNVGPNLSHCASAFVGFGSPLQAPNQDYYKPLGSSVEFGVFYKRKLSGAFSWVSEIHWQRNRLNRQNIFASVPEYKLYYQKEIFNQFGAATGLRINFDTQRGNILGTYIELKVLSSFVAGAAYKSKQGYLIGQFIDTRRYKTIEFDDRLITGYQLAIGHKRSSLSLSVLTQVPIGIVRFSALQELELKSIPMAFTYRIYFI